MVFSQKKWCLCVCVFVCMCAYVCVCVCHVLRGWSYLTSWVTLKRGNKFYDAHSIDPKTFPNVRICQVLRCWFLDSLYNWKESAFTVLLSGERLWNIFFQEKWNSVTRKWKLNFISLSRQKWKLNLIEIKFEMTRCDGQIDTDLCQYCFKIKNLRN